MWQDFLRCDLSSLGAVRLLYLDHTGCFASRASHIEVASQEKRETLSIILYIYMCDIYNIYLYHIYRYDFHAPIQMDMENTLELETVCQTRHVPLQTFNVGPSNAPLGEAAFRSGILRPGSILACTFSMRHSPVEDHCLGRISDSKCMVLKGFQISSNFQILANKSTNIYIYIIIIIIIYLFIYLFIHSFIYFLCIHIL